MEDAIRTRARLVAIGLALLLGACGTWDPTSQVGQEEPSQPATGGTPTGGAVAGGTMELTLRDQTYSFSVDECFASPEDGIRLRGSTEEGERVTIDYSADAPRERTLQVVGEDNEILLDGNHAEGVEAPSVQVDEDGFAGSATFRSTDGSEVDGEMSGAC